MNKKKLVILMCLVVAMSVFMLSSCSVYYAGKYENTTFGVTSTIELSPFGKYTTTITILGTTTSKEYTYKVKDKTITVYDKESKEEIGTLTIVDRKTLTDSTGAVKYTRV
ncbi:MAG: hypothetical protein LBT30_07915 [Clostridiales bacterium]|jgi:ABC-type uncharacterized transport system auxiliary subunit|nr:hypothetical protein [Clostridiales bacterium]